jgi:hypothetical protein
MGSTTFSLGSISIIGQSELPAPAWFVLRLFILILRLFVLRLCVLRLRGSEVDRPAAVTVFFREDHDSDVYLSCLRRISPLSSQWKDRQA